MNEERLESSVNLDAVPSDFHAGRATDVIIVSARGGRQLLAACLSSLQDHPTRRGPMSVHVVDNASNDGTVEMVREAFPWVHLESLDWNSGFCIANNRAILRTESPFVLLLNPDTEVREGSLDHCLDVLEQHPEIGMVGCRLVLQDGSFDHAAKRSFPTLLAALAHFLGPGRQRNGGRLAQYRAPQVDEIGQGAVDAINGAFMFTRRSAIEQVGLLDECYWMYFEDLDWCYRFKQHGWTVWYDGSVDVLHAKAGVSKVKAHRALRANYAFHRGMGRFYRKFSAGRRPAVDAAAYLALGLKFLISATRSSLARRSLV